MGPTKSWRSVATVFFGVALSLTVALSNGRASDDPPADPSPSAGDARPPTNAVDAFGSRSNAIPPLGLKPSEVALWHLARLFPARTMNQLVVKHDHPLGKGRLVGVTQYVDGVIVHPLTITVLLTPDGRLAELVGAPAPPPIERERLKFGADEALATTLSDLWATPFAPAMLDSAGPREGAYEAFDLTPLAELATGITFRAEARVRLIWYNSDAGLRLANEVEVDSEVPGDTTFLAYNYIISASDGAILMRRDLVHDAEMRLWIDDDLRPMAGPHADFHPHPTGQPDGSVPASVSPELVALTPFNVNPQGGSDPWLAANASVTTGNHIDAYLDLASPNGFSTGDIRTAATSTNIFDYLYDPDAAADATPEQLNASALTMFHVSNWMHDWYYNSGFTERNGNAQQSNFGRGGLQNDRMIGEAQDYALAQNASMTTPGDGGSPRLQVGNWPVPSQARVETGKSQFAPAGSASFGPQIFDVSGPFVAAIDGGGVSTADACESITNDVSGAIVLIDRGTCTFAQKATRALDAGAVGVIIANTTSGALPSMAGAGIDIPTVSLSFEHATALRAELATGPTSGRLVRTPPSTRPGTLDAAIIAHEWTHQLHIRLVYCRSYQCLAQSEGWADFAALHMLYEGQDDPQGTYAVGIFSTPGVSQDPGYYGIRRYPYSARLDRNPLTFTHVQQAAVLPTTAPRNAYAGGANTLPHRAGEVWASMLWQAYMTLIEDHGQGGARRLAYENARRRMSDYVVAGMNLAPIDPDFLEQRDAVLLAAKARDRDDWVALAGGFAERGAGSCAVAPHRALATMDGVVEDFSLAANPTIASVTLADDTASCDGDGQLDAGEEGHLSIRLVNDGPAALEGANLRLVTSQNAVLLADDTAIALPRIDPGEEFELSVAIALASDLTVPINVAVAATFESADLCDGAVTRMFEVAANHRVTPAASATEDFETPGSGWSANGSAGVWERELAADGTHAARGRDLDRATNARLTSPALRVGSGAPLTVSWEQAWSFEYQPGSTPKYFDGGVVEISLDNGNSWRDVSTYATVPYPGRIAVNSLNALSNRVAFVGESPDYPALQSLTLDLGTALAGRTILLGWRIGTDMYAGGEGWIIDRVTLTGLSVAPFQAVTVDFGPALFRDADGDGFGAGEAAPICPVVDGWVTNDDDCDDTSDAISPDDIEQCDGRDDDCDGTTDNGFDLGAACSAGVGACARDGILGCGENGAVACDAATGTPTAERCDGIDNDCDGDTDEDFALGDACTAGLGICQTAGVVVCGDDGAGGCTAAPGVAGTEICNDLDDDCDGETDEDFDVQLPCEVGVGACVSAGTTRCGQDGALICTAAPLAPSDELCDGRDNDCDEDTDENLGVGEACDAGLGECRRSGTIACQPNGQAACSALPGASQDERCDGLDNNCDGLTDEGPTCEVEVEPEPGPEPQPEADPERDPPPLDVQESAPNTGGGDVSGGVSGDKAGCGSADPAPMGWPLFGLVLGVFVLARRRRSSLRSRE